MQIRAEQHLYSVLYYLYSVLCSLFSYFLVQMTKALSKKARPIHPLRVSLYDSLSALPMPRARVPYGKMRPAKEILFSIGNPTL